VAAPPELVPLEAAAGVDCAELDWAELDWAELDGPDVVELATLDAAAGPSLVVSVAA